MSPTDDRCGINILTYLYIILYLLFQPIGQASQPVQNARAVAANLRVAGMHTEAVSSFCSIQAMIYNNNNNIRLYI